jgi:hypothetical protein
MSESSTPQPTEEEIKANFIKGQQAQFQKLKLIDLETYPYRTKEQLIGTFKREDLKKYMQVPELDANQKQLRRISKYLYNISSQYKLSCDHFSSILTLDHIVEPKNFNPSKKVNKKTLESQFYNVANTVDMMNIQHEFFKILQVVYREGVYCGYVLQDDDNFFFQQLDADYCKVTYCENGLSFISFNLTYFFVYPERLKMYPKEFQDAYNATKDQIKRKNAFFWFELDSSKTICIKTDETNWNFLPPFVSTFDAVLNIADFKALDKAETELGNTKLLFQKIPVDITGDSENKFLITPDFAQTFHNNIQTNLSKEVALITSPMDVKDISFARDSVDRNKVSEATMQYWSDAGISQLLFSSNGKTTGASLAKAIQADEAKAFVMLAQIERWINNYLAITLKIKNFRVRMLKTTVFNIDDFIKTMTSAAAMGQPVKTVINAALGGKSSSIYANSFLENEILKLSEKLEPSLSSHTMTDNSKGGAPTKKNLTESGEKTVESDSNNPDTRI